MAIFLAFVLLVFASISEQTTFREPPCRSKKLDIDAMIEKRFVEVKEELRKESIEEVKSLKKVILFPRYFSSNSSSHPLIHLSLCSS